MADGRFVSWQFCDDIRQEVGNKVSLMGCYGTKMFLAKFPVVLPKLCIQVQVTTPINKPFERLVIRVLRDDEPIAELSAEVEKFKKASVAPAWARWQHMRAFMVLSPFQVDAPCKLRVRAETEDGTVDSGAFSIEEPPTTISNTPEPEPA
jgi:hypothetical protein